MASASCAPNTAACGSSGSAGGKARCSCPAATARRRATAGRCRPSTSRTARSGLCRHAAAAEERPANAVARGGRARPRDPGAAGGARPSSATTRANSGSWTTSRGPGPPTHSVEAATRLPVPGLSPARLLDQASRFLRTAEGRRSDHRLRVRGGPRSAAASRPGAGARRAHDQPRLGGAAAAVPGRHGGRLQSRLRSLPPAAADLVLQLSRRVGRRAELGQQPRGQYPAGDLARPFPSAPGRSAAAAPAVGDVPGAGSANLPAEHLGPHRLAAGVPRPAGSSPLRTARTGARDVHLHAARHGASRAGRVCQRADPARLQAAQRILHRPRHPRHAGGSPYNENLLDAKNYELIEDLL